MFLRLLRLYFGFPPLECPKVEISLGFGEQIRDSPSNVPEMSGYP